ncbi:MAG: trypsin-like peptidase domain-containing protein [Acidobacteriota bacterium]
MATRHRRTIAVLLALLAALTVGALAGAHFAGQSEDSDVTPQTPRTRAERRDVPPLPGGPLDSDTFRSIAAAEMPMVVSIRTLTEATVPTSDFFDFGFRDDPLRRFFGLPGLPRYEERILEGAGTGFVIDGDERLVLTNNHVVENATDIRVVLFPDPESAPGDTREYRARVLGRDPLTDSALLQVTADVSLPEARLGDSDAMRPGDWVMAIGNPFGLSHTVTVGVISATSRPFPLEGRLQRVLQTDAAINPGNSGGPLLNVRGEVIGMNTAIVSPGGGNVGIGFAVPINLVRELIPSLRSGDVRRGRIGVQIRAVPSNAREALGLSTGVPGALVVSVEPDSPASRAGMQPGDVIVSFDGEDIDSPDELVDLVSNAEPGRSVPVRVVRNGQPQELQLTPDELRLTDDRVGRSRSSRTPEGFGLTIAPVTADVARQLGLENRNGALVTNVRRGSPAAEGGVRPGDVIVEVNRQPVRSVDDVVSRLRAVPEGGTAFLLVVRDGQELFLVLTRDS